MKFQHHNLQVQGP